MSKLIHRLSRVLLPVLTGFVLAAASMPARADTPAVSFTSGAPGFDTNYFTLGWVFTANSPISVDALGYYNSTGTGLKVSHNVGIFDSSGTLLAVTTVAPGITDPLIGAFRYAPITPINLVAGQTYTIGGTTDSFSNPAGYDFWASNVIGLVADPSITLPADAGRYNLQGDNTLVDPQTDGGTNLYAGPNFLIGSGPSPVPEPGSLALLLTGALPLALFRRRRTAGG